MIIDKSVDVLIDGFIYRKINFAYWFKIQIMCKSYSVAPNVNNVKQIVHFKFDY